MAEDQMVGWHHRLSGRQFEQTLRVQDREAWRAAVHGVVGFSHYPQKRNTNIPSMCKKTVASAMVRETQNNTSTYLLLLTSLAKKKT